MTVLRGASIIRITLAIFLSGLIFVPNGNQRIASALPDSARLLRPSAVANDDFDQATVISGIPYSSTQDIITATVAADDPILPCSSGQRFNTVWYRYTPVESEDLVFSSDRSQYPINLAIWTGSRGSLINRLCVNATQGSLALTAGITYYIEAARSSDYIIPAPSTINLVFSIWPAGTLPTAFNKTAPENGNATQPTRPTLRWESSTYQAKYEFCYDKVDNNACDGSWQETNATNAPLTGLTKGTRYYWQVWAVNLDGTADANAGAWWSFNTASPADLNRWSGLVSGSTRKTSFDVFTDGMVWLNLSIEVPYDGCNKTGVATINVGGPGNMSNRKIDYSTSSLSYQGTFTTLTQASGTYQLTYYPVCVWTQPGYCCWAITSGSGLWNATGPALPPLKSVYLPLLQGN